jgi:hypothetical protein
MSDELMSSSNPNFITRHQEMMGVAHQTRNPEYDTIYYTAVVSCTITIIIIVDGSM